MRRDDGVLMSGKPITLDHQALALWHVDVRPYRQHAAEMGMPEFTAAIYAARVTLNIVATDPDIRKLVMRKAAEIEAKARSA